MSRSEILEKYPTINELQKEHLILQGIRIHYQPETPGWFVRYCNAAGVTQGRINEIRWRLYSQIVENGDLPLLRSGAIRQIVLS